MVQKREKSDEGQGQREKETLVQKKKEKKKFNSEPKHANGVVPRVLIYRKLIHTWEIIE